VELCDWLMSVGADVRVHDPMVRDLPQRWSGAVQHCADPLAAATDAQALVIGTEWPPYQAVTAEQLAACSNDLIVLDANRALAHLATAGPPLRYFAVGVPGMGG
jgi:UDPglucose 6-dehydrogenase